MNKAKEKWKSLFSKENMIVLTLLGILLLVIAIPTEEKKKVSNSESGLTDSGHATMELSESLIQDEMETPLEKRLADFLSCMEGAGTVRVMISFSESEEKVVEKDLKGTGWQDAGNEERRISDESTVFATDDEGTQTPYVKKTLAAKAEGVTVLAQGGDLPEVQKQITEMIEALFGLEAHKIRVAKMK